MRHSEGDIIRPRDSVLLRAGSKRAELPYVAKVAHLWENPEDGKEIPPINSCSVYKLKFYLFF